MPELRGRITEGSTTKCWEYLAAWNHKHYRSFPGSPGPLYQNEVKCSAFDMEMIFHSHANKTHFHEKGCVCTWPHFEREDFWNSEVAYFFAGSEGISC